MNLPPNCRLCHGTDKPAGDPGPGTWWVVDEVSGGATPTHPTPEAAIAAMYRQRERLATNTTITFGSLFSGIGGLDLGLERSGMTCRWQVELDDYATRVLHKHWPHVARFRDVRDCGGHNLTPVDLICGGFPCQPHSLAGKRRAGADERDLWGEFARIIRELRPRWVLAENVPGLLSSDHGRFFGRVLRDLAACGYDAAWSVLSACALGAPHTRERVFIVAYADQGRGIGRNQRPDGSFSTHWREAGQRAPRAVKTQGSYQADGWWAVEPDVARVADGVSRRMDRLRGLGNAVVPQVAEYIGRCIVAAEQQGKAA